MEMIKKNAFIIAAISVLIAQLCTITSSSADSPQNVPAEINTKQIDGLHIMTKVDERNRGEDYIARVAWTLMKKGRVQQRARYTEKRKNYGGKDGFNYKSVIRYSEPPKIYKKALLTWTYTNGKRDYWYFLAGFRDAQRTFSLSRFKSQAEVDFPLEDYVDIPPETESYRLLSSEEFDDTTCYLIESTPHREEVPFGKRVSYIDQQNLIPLKVNYFDKKGALWKVLRITWQNISGVWFWKKAVVENVQEEYSTYIIIEEVKFNSDLNEREFTRIALERSKE
jgi:hypothetical protein